MQARVCLHYRWAIIVVVVVVVLFLCGGGNHKSSIETDTTR